MTTLSFVSTSAFGLEAWHQDKSYPGGSSVCYGTKEYNAKWWAEAGQAPDSGEPWVLDTQALDCTGDVVTGNEADDNGDPYVNGVTVNPTGGYFIDADLLVQAEADRTASDDFAKIKHTIRTLDNESVEQVLPGRAGNPGNVKRLESILSSQAWSFLFPHRAAEYDYRKFLQAVAKFPAFCGHYDTIGKADAICRRSLATLFAHMTRETGAFEQTLGTEQWRQGLYFTRQVGCSDGSLNCGYNNTCSPALWQGQTWPCGKDAQGRYLKYYGRGARQLSYNFNYGAFSDAIFGDATVLLNDPDRVADSWLNLASAVFFFVYPQPPKPAMLAVIDGSWRPNAADIAQGIRPGFGATINIVAGGNECGRTTKRKSQSPNPISSRVDIYKHYANYLGVPIKAKEVLDCKNQGRFTGDGAGALKIHYEEDWLWHSNRVDARSFECKLVDYQTPYFALAIGAYERCVKDKFNAIAR